MISKKNNTTLKQIILMITVLCLLNIEAKCQQPNSDTTKTHSAENASLNANGEDEPALENTDNPKPPNPTNANLSDVSRMSLREFNLSLIILAFGLIVFVAEFFLLRTVSCTAEQLLRIFGITLIVMGTLLMVPAGFSAQAIAPAMGLLGTIAGYLLSQRPGNQGDGSKKDQSTDQKTML